MKIALVVIFCANNINKDLNADENIINTNNFLNKGNLTQNENLIDYKDLNIELLNLNFTEFLENLFASIYENNEFQYKSKKIIKTATRNSKISQISYKRPKSKK